MADLGPATSRIYLLIDPTYTDPLREWAGAVPARELGLVYQPAVVDVVTDPR